jgi:hypothetical protein
MKEAARKITRHGRTAAVIVAGDEWERKTKRTGNLAEFLADMTPHSGHQD